MRDKIIENKESEKKKETPWIIVVFAATGKYAIGDFENEEQAFTYAASNLDPDVRASVIQKFSEFQAC